MIEGSFRSQTSGNMDRWKSWGGKSQRRAEKKQEDQRRERVSRKKMQARKGRKVVIVFSNAQEGRKVGLLKRRVRSHLARCEMKNCTALWCEAHFEVNSVKADSFGALFKVEMSKKRTPLWREARFQVRMYKAHHAWSTFGSWDVEKVHAVVARSTSGIKNGRARTTFVSMWFCVACARDSAPCPKRESFVAYPKRWQVWDIWRRSAKMDFAWQVQCKRHAHQRC